MCTKYSPARVAVEPIDDRRGWAVGCMVGVPVQVLGRALLCCMATLAPPKTRAGRCAGLGTRPFPGWLGSMAAGVGDPRSSVVLVLALALVLAPAGWPDVARWLTSRCRCKMKTTYGSPAGRAGTGRGDRPLAEWCERARGQEVPRSAPSCNFTMYCTNVPSYMHVPSRLLHYQFCSVNPPTDATTLSAESMAQTQAQQSGEGTAEGQGQAPALPRRRSCTAIANGRQAKTAG